MNMLRDNEPVEKNMFFFFVYHKVFQMVQMRHEARRQQPFQVFRLFFNSPSPSRKILRRISLLQPFDACSRFAIIQLKVFYLQKLKGIISS